MTIIINMQKKYNENLMKLYNFIYILNIIILAYIIYIYIFICVWIIKTLKTEPQMSYKSAIEKNLYKILFLLSHGQREEEEIFLPNRV